MSDATVIRHQVPRPRPSQGPVHVRAKASSRRVSIDSRRQLCYHCEEASYVYRRCPYRRMGLKGFAVNAPRLQQGKRPRVIADCLAATQ